jgi:hypothetical protein
VAMATGIRASHSAAGICGRPGAARRGDAVEPRADGLVRQVQQKSCGDGEKDARPA